MTRRRGLGKPSESRNNFERVYRGNPNGRDVSLCSWSSRAGRLEVLVLTVDEGAGKKTSHRTTHDEQPAAGIVGVLGTAGVGAAGSASPGRGNTTYDRGGEVWPIITGPTAPEQNIRCTNTMPGERTRCLYFHVIATTEAKYTPHHDPVMTRNRVCVYRPGMQATMLHRVFVPPCFLGTSVSIPWLAVCFHPF